MLFIYYLLPATLLVAGVFGQSALIAAFGVTFLAILGRKWWSYVVAGLASLPYSIYWLGLEQGPFIKTLPMLFVVGVVAATLLIDFFAKGDIPSRVSISKSSNGLKLTTTIAVAGSLLTLLRPELWWSDAIAGFTISVILMRHGMGIRRAEIARKEEALGLIKDCNTGGGGGCQGCSSTKGKLFGEQGQS